MIQKWSKTQLVLAKFLNDINVFFYKNINFEYPRKELFYKRFADIINYTAKKYRELKPGNHFYVGIYPGEDKDLKWTQYLDEKIIVLRVKPPLDYDNKSKYELKGDYHPSKASNLYYAEELTRLINEYEKNW